jgi:hypothetical protein
MIIGRGRHREHPQPTLFTTTTGVAQLPLHTPKRTPKGVKWPSGTSGSHGTTTKKKAREKAGHAQSLLPVRATSGHFGQKALLGRIWRNFRLRMRITYFRTWHLTNVIYGHVTDVTSGHIASGHVTSPHSTPSNANWPVPIYYSRHYSFQWYMI